VQVKAFPANCQRKIKQLALNGLRHQKVKIRFYFAKRLYYKFVTVWWLQRQMLKRAGFQKRKSQSGSSANVTLQEA
jgi:hypothetical protein